MNITEARKELSGYRFADKVIKDGEYELMKHRSRANKLVSTYELQEGSFCGGVSDRLAEYATAAAMELDKIGDDLRALKERNEVIRSVIFGEMYGKYQLTLAETYIYGQDPKDVAEDIGMDLKQFYHLRDQAVKIYAKIRSCKEN